MSRTAEGNTGTWNGPAPRGAPSAGQCEAGSAPTSQPTTVLLNNGHRMPLLGFGTYKIQSPGALRCKGCCLVVCFK